MIVYAGKQYGNDFNNGDEALFQDANRPRDSQKFKLEPGVSTQKTNFRTANSGMAAQGIFYGVKLEGQQTWYAHTFHTADIKSSYTASDMPDMTGYGYASKETAAMLKSEIIGSPSVALSDGDVLIGKTGMYAVTCECDFLAPSGYNPQANTFRSNSAYSFFVVALMLNGSPVTYTQGRGCGPDMIYTVFRICHLNAGDKVNTGFYHTYEGTVLCFPTVNLYRLS